MPARPLLRPVAALAATALVVVAASLGCQSMPAGKAAFEILSPPTLPRAVSHHQGQPEKSDLRVVSIEPYARGELAHPLYPQSALAEHAGRRRVFITFTIDETGATVDIRRSIARVELTDRFSRLFEAAAIDAVRQWKFEPARLVYWRSTPGKDDQYVGVETISVTFEVKFTFETSGRVQ